MSDLPQRTCAVCGQPYQSRKLTARYCSEPCRKAGNPWGRMTTVGRAGPAGSGTEKEGT